MKRICVFCGSHAGTKLIYRQTAKEMGRLLASNDIELVYGGGSRGLMGAIADAVLADGGTAIGVVPDNMFEQEHVHSRLTDLRIVTSLLERKALMVELSEGFVALPGGLGTMNEFFEIWTWSQLGLHTKPCGLLNVAGYYDPLIIFLDAMVDKRFVSMDQRTTLLVHETPTALLNAFTHGKSSMR